MLNAPYSHTSNPHAESHPAHARHAVYIHAHAHAPPTRTPCAHHLPMCPVSNPSSAPLPPFLSFCTRRCARYPPLLTSNAAARLVAHAYTYVCSQVASAARRYRTIGAPSEQPPKVSPPPSPQPGPPMTGWFELCTHTPKLSGKRSSLVIIHVH